MCSVVGTLVEKGNHASLMEKKGTYYALVAAQESSHIKPMRKRRQNEAAMQCPTTRLRRTS